MVVTIHQPGYLPWHGLFHRLALCDLHIFFDSAQFEKNGFNNRVKIKTQQGVKWLTVPVRMKGHFGNSPISRTEINNEIDWCNNHRKTLLQNYSRAPYYRNYENFFNDVFSKTWDVLGDLNMFTIEHIAGILGINCRFVRASDLDAPGAKGELVVNLCKSVGATIYISGINGMDYLKNENFQSEGIELRLQTYHEPEYNQLYGGFEPFMSIADLLFNRGAGSLDVIMNGQDTLQSGTTLFNA